MAFKLCGNKEDAEDITQNACIKLARSIDTFRFQSAFLSWLYRLVINTAKDWKKVRPLQAADQTIEADCAEAPVAEDSVYAGQVLSRHRTFMSRQCTSVVSSTTNSIGPAFLAPARAYSAALATGGLVSSAISSLRIVRVAIDGASVFMSTDSSPGVKLIIRCCASRTTLSSRNT